MIRKSLLVLSCFFALAASAQFTITRSNKSISGTISRIEGTRVYLLDDRLVIDVAEDADIASDAGFGSLATLQPGMRIKAGVVPWWDGSLRAMSIHVESDHDASLYAIIDRVDFANSTFLIAGQTVRFTEATEVRRVMDGARVRSSELRPLQWAFVGLDRAAEGVTANFIAFTPLAAGALTTGGVLTAVDGNRWTIGSGPRATVVRVTDETFVGGEPKVRDYVQVTYRGSAAGDLEAVVILRVSDIEENDVAGEVRSMNGNTITIEGKHGAKTLRIDETTKFRGTPKVGDVASARPGGDGNLAASVEVVYATHSTFGFGGEITSIDGNSWTAAGVTFVVTPQTHVTGDPHAGNRVDVLAFELNDRWYAMTVAKL